MPELAKRIEQEPPRERDGPMPPVTPPEPDNDRIYLSSFYAEQVPFAVAGFVYARGEPDAIPVTCMLGRDADSTATTVGSWVGALHGEAGLPAGCVETVCRANREEIDLRLLAERLRALPG